MGGEHYDFCKAVIPVKGLKDRIVEHLKEPHNNPYALVAPADVNELELFHFEVASIRLERKGGTR